MKSIKLIILALSLSSCSMFIHPPSPKKNAPVDEVIPPITIIPPTDDNFYYKKISQVSAPVYREDFFMSEIDANRMVMFGGQNFTNAFSDFYVFDLAKNEWHTEKVPAEIQPRFGAEGAKVRFLNKDYLFVWGGAKFGNITEKVGERLSNGFIYDVENNSFEVLSTVDAPAARVGHKVIAAGEYVIVWGGEVNGKLLNDGGFYNLRTKTWTSLSRLDFPSLSDSQYPEAREQHHLFFDKANSRMIIYGGVNGTNQSSSGLTNDIWEYKFSLNDEGLKTGVWTKLADLSEDNQRRVPDAGFDALNQKIVVYGGSRGEDLKNGSLINLSSPVTDMLISDENLGYSYNHRQNIIVEGNDYYFFAKDTATKHAIWRFMKNDDGSYKAINILLHLTGEVTDDDIGRFYTRVGNSIVFWGNRACTIDNNVETCATKNSGLILKDLTNYE